MAIAIVAAAIILTTEVFGLDMGSNFPVGGIGNDAGFHFLPLLADDHTILDAHDAIGVGQRARIMRDG
jgi:hypothetical protein